MSGSSTEDTVAGTNSALSSLQKSRQAPYPVTITGRPLAMASAIGSPNPSPR